MAWTVRANGPMLRVFETEVSHLDCCKILHIGCGSHLKYTVPAVIGNTKDVSTDPLASLALNVAHLMTFYMGFATDAGRN